MRCRNWLSLALAAAAVAPAAEVLTSLDSSPDGLPSAQAQRRLEIAGPNALRSHGARPLAVLARQLRNPLLVLLLGAALTSFFVGERLDALIIFLISGLSIGLGFFNEYRSERAVEALHSQLRHTVLVVRDRKPQRVDVTELVPAFMARRTRRRRPRRGRGAVMPIAGEQGPHVLVCQTCVRTCAGKAATPCARTPM